MDVRIVTPAPMDRHRVWQSLPPGEFGSEARGQLPLLPIVQLDRQGELHFFEQAPVGPFVCVCRRPVFLRVVLGPFRHIPGFAVSKFIAVFLILSFPFDVVGFGLGTLPTAPRSGLHTEVIYSHIVTDISALSTTYLKEIRKSALSLSFESLFRHDDTPLFCHIV